MTTSMFCASRCKFCWRGQKAPVSKEWYGPIDSPEHIITHSIDEHLKLLQGFRGMGYDKADRKKINEMDNIRHVALSLTGEPITYPLINEISKAFHKRKISTFLVTNSQYPEQIKKIEKVTQLYLSIDAPNKKLMKKIDNPLLEDYWERMLACLNLLKTRTYRTCIRLTMIKNENMIHHEQYAELIKMDYYKFQQYMNPKCSQNGIFSYNCQHMLHRNLEYIQIHHQSHHHNYHLFHYKFQHCFLYYRCNKCLFLNYYIPIHLPRISPYLYRHID